MNKKLILAVVGIMLVVVFSTCALAVNEPMRYIPIIEPYISEQPQSYSYAVGEFTTAPKLTATLNGWKGIDGALSYRWYTFDSVEAFCASGGTPLGSAVTVTPSEDPDEEINVVMEYTPDVTPAAGKIYYYYVAVTNDSPESSDKTRVTINSEVVMISFYDTVPYPVITRQPIGASYRMGRAAVISPLEVRAAPPSSGVLSYQWYTNSKFSVTDGEKIEGAIFNTYMPDVDALDIGDNFFYVVVTNTAGSDESPITCIPVIITMQPGDQAEPPRIDAQPKDQMVFTGGTIAALSVSAESIDRGRISYQWYSADKALLQNGDREDTIKGTAISGATSATYRPTVSTGAAGKSYYYVEVTNNNSNVTGEKTSTLRSNVVTVTVAAAGALAENATITISDPSVSTNRNQYIRGYGGMDVAWANFPETTEADTELMYNPDWGLGYNILRIMITPPGSNDGNYNGHEELVQKLLDNHRKDYLNNVKIVNKYGGFVLASPWTPPKEWKTNNSINSGGHLIPTYYKLFANYLKSFAQFMSDMGAPIYAVSIANEPNYAGGYDGCEWTPAQMRDFWLEVGHFTDGVRGHGGGRALPAVLTMNGESANNPNINFAALNNAQSRSVVDLYARHVYGSQTETLWSNDFADYKEDSPYQTECWMTEHNINSATPTAFPNDSTWPYVWRFMNDIDLVIRLNNENAFVWWASKRFYSMIGDGQATTGDGVALPRGWGLAHFAKYTIDTTRINFTMTGTLANGTPIGTLNRPATQIVGGQSVTNYVNTTSFSLDSQDAKITAYVSQDGSEISMVMFTPTATSGSGGVDLGTIKINLPEGFEIGSAKATRSTSRTDIFMAEDVTISEDRKSAYVTLGRAEILSLKFTKQ